MLRCHGLCAMCAFSMHAVPPGYDRLEIDAMEDAIWGADGFDT